MPILQIENLTKSYVSPDKENHLVINVPEFSVKASQQLGIQGTSGCGKTTFLNLISGILQADGGKILIDGKDMAAAGEKQRDLLRASYIGYIFQTFNLLHGYTALENVTLGMMFGTKGVDYAFAKELLSRVGLQNRMDYRPQQLSVGQQQRVAVARALANKPQIVLADEPTGNLDFRNAQEALSLVREICKENDAALLLVSHDENILQSFETRVTMSDINLAAQKQ